MLDRSIPVSAGCTLLVAGLLGCIVLVTNGRNELAIKLAEELWSFSTFPYLANQIYEKFKKKHCQVFSFLVQVKPCCFRPLAFTFDPEKFQPALGKGL
jgi:hypothetical protein